MGKMINVFDLSAGMTGNQLLTEKGHGDGSPVRRNRSDTVKKQTDPVRGHIDERLITINDVRKSSPSKKSSATPMKMLIAQELLKETEAKRKQPSIVARLMGLDDTLPVQQPVLTAKRNSNESYPRSKSAGVPRGRRQPGDAKLERSMSHEIHSCSHEKEYKDVYVVCQQPSRTNHSRYYAPQKERLTEIQDTKRMTLVRQKFMEAKRLATDEKLLHSKEFQDALEVLSSNRDEEDGPNGQRRERVFTVTIRYVARAYLHQLEFFLIGRQSDAPQEALQVLDIVLRELPTSRYCPVARSFYSPELGTRQSLGGG